MSVSKSEILIEHVDGTVSTGPSKPVTTVTFFVRAKEKRRMVNMMIMNYAEDTSDKGLGFSFTAALRAGGIELATEEKLRVRLAAEPEVTLPAWCAKRWCGNALSQYDALPITSPHGVMSVATAWKDAFMCDDPIAIRFIDCDQIKTRCANPDASPATPHDDNATLTTNHVPIPLYPKTYMSDGPFLSSGAIVPPNSVPGWFQETATDYPGPANDLINPCPENMRLNSCHQSCDSESACIGFYYEDTTGKCCPKLSKGDSSTECALLCDANNEDAEAILFDGQQFLLFDFKPTTDAYIDFPSAQLEASQYVSSDSNATTDEFMENCAMHCLSLESGFGFWQKWDPAVLLFDRGTSY
jgi:hypothetical protein